MNSKRTLSLFYIFMLLFAGITYRLYYLADSSYSLTIREAAQRQQQLQIPMAKRRGFIYDCKLQPLNYSKEGQLALVEPAKAADTAALRRTLYYRSPASAAEIDAALSAGEPFSLFLRGEAVQSNGIRSTQGFLREDTVQAPHLVGYVSKGEELGVTGIEKAYNDYLQETGGEIYAVGQRIASGQLLNQGEVNLVDNNYYLAGGVALTLDKDLQSIVELGAEKIPKGAVVLVETGSNKIRALASSPTFSTSRVAEYLNSTEGEFINRGLEPYNVGSIFKILVAAVTLEDNVKTNSYTCTGSIEIAGRSFSCHNKAGHGTVDFQTAFAQSCNPYFIQLCGKLDFSHILEISRKLGISDKYPLAPSILKKAGLLPRLSDQDNLRAVANTAIGQGNVMATPLDLAMLITAVVNGGTFTPPSLIEGLVKGDGSMAGTLEVGTEPVRLMSEKTAARIAELMVLTCQKGTGRGANPMPFGAGGKTASAETGWVQNGEAVIHGIFAGFFPADKPQYALIVLVENGRTGGGAAGPIFKEIAESVMALQSTTTDTALAKNNSGGT